jgi:hypothetical protein
MNQIQEAFTELVAAVISFVTEAVARLTGIVREAIGGAVVILLMWLAQYGIVPDLPDVPPTPEPTVVVTVAPEATVTSVMEPTVPITDTTN